MRTLAVLFTAFVLAVLYGWYSSAMRASEEAVFAAEKALAVAGSRCEPIYQVAYPEWGCSFKFGAPPLKCEFGVKIYRHQDEDRVLAVMEHIGKKPGMVLLEEKGVRERYIAIEWVPKRK